MQPQNELAHRFKFHPADTEKKQNDHAMVRTLCGQLAQYLTNHLPAGRELSLAITNLEQTMMWANAAIARDVDRSTAEPE